MKVCTPSFSQAYRGERFVLFVSLGKLMIVFSAASPHLVSFGSVPMHGMIMAKRVFFIF